MHLQLSPVEPSSTKSYWSRDCNTD